MSVSGDKFVPGLGPDKGTAPVGPKDTGRVAGGRKFEIRAAPSKSYKLATDYLKSMFVDFGKIRSASFTLSDAKKIKAFEKQLEDLKDKLEFLEQNLTEEEKSDITPKVIRDLEQLIFSQLLDLKDRENMDKVEKNINEIEQKLSEMTILHYKGKMNRLYSAIDSYYSGKLRIEERNEIFDRYDDLRKDLRKQIVSLADKVKDKQFLASDEIEDLEEKLALFSNEFLSIKRIIAAKKMQSLQDKLNILRARLTKVADNLSTEKCKKEVSDLIERLPSSLTVRDDQLEIDQLDQVVIDLEDEMVQIKKEVDNVIIRDIFETKHKDFIGAKKISRIEYQDLSHSYFVIREVKAGKVEFTVQQQFHKKLGEAGFIDKGAVKDVHKLKSPKTGEISGVRAVLKIGKTPIPQGIQAVKEFRDDPNLCGGHYLTYKSKKSGEVKHVFLHPYMGGGNLVELLQKIGKADQSSQIKIMLQICRGIKKMHDRGWIHKDIKPENILVQIDPMTNEIILKLADFDSAEKPAKDSRLADFGTPLFIAPELVRRGVYGLEAGKKCDIYSLGMTFWLISENEYPYFNANRTRKRLAPPTTYNELVKVKNFPEPGKQTPMQRLIYEMINPLYPKKRPSIDEVISVLEQMQLKA